MKESEINQVFELIGKKYIAEANKNESMCIGCVGNFSNLCQQLPECDAEMRADNTEVIFKEIDDA